MQTAKVSTENALSGWREIASLNEVATAVLPDYCFSEECHAGTRQESFKAREPPFSRDSERVAVRSLSDELWPFRDRKSKKIGNPPFNRLKAQIIADGLQFVLSATKLPLTNEPGAGFRSRFSSYEYQPEYFAIDLLFTESFA